MTPTEIQRQPIIAIDGPAGSGKSTTARMLAKKLGFTYLDTGAFYRAMTLKVLESDFRLDDSDNVVKLAVRTKIEIEPDADGDRVYLDGREVTGEIRSPRVTNAIGPIAGNPKVRKIMMQQQREFGSKGGVVMEGRDIGTVVFPEAELKIFMTASLEERTRRRQKELNAKGIQKNFNALLEEIRARDERDAQRDVAPLRRAKDAIELDTTGMTLHEQVDFIIQSLQKKSTERTYQN